MSSVIINPTRRAENSIYLAFAVLVVTSLQYAFELYAPTENFQLDILGITIVGSLLAAFLLYPELEKRFLEDCLSKRVTSDLTKQAEFILNSVFLLESYTITTQPIPSPDTILLEKTREVLDGEELAAQLWKLRAAILFVLSLPFTGVIVFFYFSNYLITIGAMLVLLVAIVEPSWSEYKKMAGTLSELVQFHWFDELLTSVRRTEISADTDTTKVDLKVEGVAANIYVGQKGSSGSEGGKSIAQHKNEQSRLPILVSGYIYGIGKKEREEKRKRNALYTEECIFLRELNTLRDWSRFASRFASLRSHLIINGRESVELYARYRITKMWEMALTENTGSISAQQFNHFRRLVFKMKSYNLLSQTISTIMDLILEPKLENMLDWSFSYHYYLKKGPDNVQVRKMFLKHMNNKVKERGWEPTPIDERASQNIDEARMLQESWVENQERERYGSNVPLPPFKIFRDIEDDILENPPKEEY